MTKKILGIAAVFIISANLGFAQIDIQPFVGWQIGGKAKFVEGELDIKSDMNYGVVLDVEIRKGLMLELYYSQMNTTAFWAPYPGFSGIFPATNLGMDVEYFQVGAIKYIQKGNIEPFGGLTLGAAWFTAYANEDRTGNSDSETRFAMTLGGGVKVMPSDRIGLRFEGRLLMPMYFAGVGLWAGTGGGGASVGAVIPILQADFTAAVVIRLGTDSE